MGCCRGVRIALFVLDGFSAPLHEHVIAPAALAIHADSDAVAIERLRQVHEALAHRDAGRVHRADLVGPLHQ